MCCDTCFGPFSGFLSCRALSPSCGRPTPGRPNPRSPLAHKLSSRHCRLGFSLVLVFSFEKQRLIRCNCGDKSFYSDPVPPFLISSTVSISLLESSSQTPLWFASTFIFTISDCVFTSSCLCFSIRLQKKLSRRDQSSCAWLITNGVVV